MEKVTLYIPCFNAEKTIKECLESVIQQTYPIDEIIIIDDGCQDKTMDIVSKYPVRVIKHFKNKGLAAARNTAFNESRNDFVAALDADCAASDNWLAELMSCFSNEDIVGAGGMLIERYSKNTADKWRSLRMSQTWGKEVIENPPFLYGSNTVFRKTAIQFIGMYSEIFRSNYEDVNISSKLYDKELRLIYNPKSIAEHLRKDTVISVLTTYWHWQYYRNIKFSLINKFHLWATSRWVSNFDFADDIISILRQDWQGGDHELIFVDLTAVFLFPWLDIKYCFQQTLYRIGRIWKSPT